MEGDTRCVQQGWCVPGNELFLSMGCACWAEEVQMGLPG